MMNPLQILFGLLVALAVWGTVWGYPRKYGALSGRSRLFRTVGVVLLDLLVITLFIFVSTDWQAQMFQIGIKPTLARNMVRASQLLYFTTWLLIGLMLLFVALLDWLENFTIYRKQRREAVEAMIAETVAAHQKRKPAPAGMGDNQSGGATG